MTPQSTLKTTPKANHNKKQGAKSAKASPSTLVATYDCPQIQRPDPERNVQPFAEPAKADAAHFRDDQAVGHRAAPVRDVDLRVFEALRR